MSKKTYQLFANAIAEIEDEEQREKQLCLIANVCKQDNFRFDWDRFRERIKRKRAGVSTKGLG